MRAARNTSVGLAIVAGLVVTTLLPTASAAAASTTVMNVTQLTTALANCASAPNTITIGADISAPAQMFTVACDTTIDLTTHDLTVRSLIIGTGRTLTVTGPLDDTSGVLTADASTETNAGIRTTGATLRVTGGRIVATGGIYGAGIGGDNVGTWGGTFIMEAGHVTARGTGSYGTAIGGANGGGSPGGHGGVLTVNGGTVVAEATQTYAPAIGGGAGTPGGAGATITVNGGTLQASGTGFYAATVGGGTEHGVATGAAGSLTIGPAGTVILSSYTGARATVFGPGPATVGVTPGAPGTLIVNGDLHLSSGKLELPAGTTAVVGATGRILGAPGTPTVGAAIVGESTITNNGVIALAPDRARVTGNSRTLTFTGGVSSVNVFAPNLASGFRSLPTPPDGTAWNTAADGAGTWFTTSTGTSGSGTTALYSVAAPTIEVSDDPADLVATAGEAFAFPLTVLGPSGAPIDPQPNVTVTSSDCSFTGAGVFTVAGECSLHATSTWGPFTPSVDFSIEVVAGPAAALAISPSAVSTDAGTPTVFTVTAVDAYGNPTSADGAELSSSNPDDEISGLSVTPSTVGSRTIAASLGTAGTATPATLTATLPTVVWSAPDIHVTAGDTVSFAAIIRDEHGVPLSPQPSITYVPSCSYTGWVVITTAGACPVTASATLYGETISTGFDIVVSAGPAVALTITPTDTTVEAGTPAAYTVAGVDAYGNAASMVGVVLSSSVPDDEISGLTVTPVTTGARTITATLGAATTATPATLTATMPVTSWQTPVLEITAGDPLVLDDVVVLDELGVPLSPQPAISYSSPCAATWLGTLTTAGLCPVTASATLFGETISTVFEVTVHEASLDTLTLTTTAGSVRQGGSLTFTVSGADAYGNPVDVSSAHLTSSVPTDVVDGLTVTFPHASPHVITVTVGDVSSSVTIEVIPAALVNAGASVDAGVASLALLSVLIGVSAVTMRRRAARRA